jgi:DNA-directed RNA polymerase sigma subunit (sigma70/sigma32)
MAQHKGSDVPPPEPRRREIFMALVEAQDQEMSVAQSRRHIAERFGVSESQVRQIEQEGLDREWPPL